MKEFGFIQADAEEDSTEEDRLDPVATDQHSLAINRTRSGRHVRPPNRIMKDLKLTKIQDEQKEEEHPVIFASPPPFLEYSAPTVTRRSLSHPDKYSCQVCGKVYMGKKKMARHLKV